MFSVHFKLKFSTMVEQFHGCGRGVASGQKNDEFGGI